MTDDVRMIAVTDEAGCRQPDTSPEWWFDEADRAQAVGICNRCTFQAPCLQYALRVNVRGVWGGTNEVQRRRLRQEQGINAQPASFAPGRNNGWVARQMASRGVAVRLISDRLGISEQAVRQLLAAS